VALRVENDAGVSCSKKRVVYLNSPFRSVDDPFLEDDTLKINLLRFGLDNYIKVINKILPWEDSIQEASFEIQEISRHGLKCDGDHIKYIKWRNTYPKTDWEDFCTPLCLFEAAKEEKYGDYFLI